MYTLIYFWLFRTGVNSLYEWQEIEALELGNKKIDELRKGGNEGRGRGEGREGDGCEGVCFQIPGR